MAGVTLLDLDRDRVVSPSGGAAILPGCKNDADLGIGGNGDDCVTGGAEGSCVAGSTVTGANGGGTADGAGGGADHDATSGAGGAGGHDASLSSVSCVATMSCKFSGVAGIC